MSNTPTSSDQESTDGHENNLSVTMLEQKDQPNHDLTGPECGVVVVVPASLKTHQALWSIWNSRERKIIILAASFATLFSPLTAQIYLPALDVIATDLHVSDSDVNLSITTYMVGLAASF